TSYHKTQPPWAPLLFSSSAFRLAYPAVISLSEPCAILYLERRIAGAVAMQTLEMDAAVGTEQEPHSDCTHSPRGTYLVFCVLRQDEKWRPKLAPAHGGGVDTPP